MITIATQDLSYYKQCLSLFYPNRRYWPKIKEFSILCQIPRFKLLYIKGREPKRLAKKILYLDENIETEEIPITPSLTRPKFLAERMIATITNTSINNESEIDKSRVILKNLYEKNGARCLHHSSNYFKI
ncbi:hypothetical protein BpHYR1_031805 [Brachionus plicatilis]|uniref:Uncharacterized protein n=1 Tax=Brachionus plicatilis TaxID=10195 RepID=A0A3M7PUG1_BRAPC|nr:hypothetical protein BpHYR1_031805 [Brachionus plicatilis]